jgi:hypothetical protein
MSDSPPAASFIELDGQSHPFTEVTLELDGSDCYATLHRDGAPALELAGEVEEDGRLHLDLRALDEVFGALLGRPITAYPGGQEVCAAHLDMRELDGGGLLLSTQFEFDWDRALDPPEASYPEPRRARVQLHAAAPGRDRGPS